MKKRIYSTLFFLLFWFGVLFSVAETFIKSRYACQGDKLRIRCRSRLMIRIFSANFGRTEPGSSICPNVNTSDTTCKSSRALDIVSSKCTYRARCNIKADSSMFPDPCPNTFKYLDVIYGCVPRPPNMSTEAPRKRRRTTPRYQATTTAQWVKTDHVTTTAMTQWVKTEYETTTTQPSPVTTRKAITTEINITTLEISPTPLVEVKKTNVEPTSTSTQNTTSPPPLQAKSGYIQRGEKEFLINVVVSLYLTYVILSGQPKYVLILFLSGVAIATVLLLVLLLGLHLKGRRTKKFVMNQEKEIEPANHEADEDIDDDVSDDDENKNVTLEIQGANEETQQISVKPGDIIIIDRNDVENDDSEDLGYMSEIVRYYNSRNMVQDDGKQSLTCETPSVNSIPNSEVGDKREPQYDDVPKDNGICVT